MGQRPSQELSTDEFAAEPRAEIETPSTVALWERVVRRAQRLARLRRWWAVVGQYLREVKQRGCDQ